MDEATEVDRPLCACHGEAMTKRNDRPSGWRCSVAHGEAQFTYEQTTQGILAEQRWQTARQKEQHAGQT